MLNMDKFYEAIEAQKKLIKEMEALIVQAEKMTPQQALDEMAVAWLKKREDD